MKQQLARLENHMTQLISMVAENNKTTKVLCEKFDGLEQRFDGLELRFDGLEQRFDTEKELNKLRFEELIKEIRNMKYESDYLRDQVSRHDVEIHKLNQKII